VAIRRRRAHEPAGEGGPGRRNEPGGRWGIVTSLAPGMPAPASRSQRARRAVGHCHGCRSSLFLWLASQRARRAVGHCHFATVSAPDLDTLSQRARRSVGHCHDPALLSERTVGHCHQLESDALPQLGSQRARRSVGHCHRCAKATVDSVSRRKRARRSQRAQRSRGYSDTLRARWSEARVGRIRPVLPSANSVGSKQ